MSKGHDFVSTLGDLPPRHSGVMFEQLHQASLSAALYMRAVGLCLPGNSQVPTHAEVAEHLTRLTNLAMATYFDIQRAAPANTAANEIWGTEEDDLFTVEVTGISKMAGDGYVLAIDMNILYGR